MTPLHDRWKVARVRDSWGRPEYRPQEEWYDVNTILQKKPVPEHYAPHYHVGMTHMAIGDGSGSGYSRDVVLTTEQASAEILAYLAQNATNTCTVTVQPHDDSECSGFGGLRRGHKNEIAKRRRELSDLLHSVNAVNG